MRKPRLRHDGVYYRRYLSIAITNWILALATRMAQR